MQVLQASSSQDMNQAAAPGGRARNILNQGGHGPGTDRKDGDLLLQILTLPAGVPATIGRSVLPFPAGPAGLVLKPCPLLDDRSINLNMEST